MSLFQLPKMPSIPHNGVSGAYYERLELAQGLNFSEESFGGQRLEFRWNCGTANHWYVPSRSYIRFRFRLNRKTNPTMSAVINYADPAQDAERAKAILPQVFMGRHTSAQNADAADASVTSLNKLYLQVVDPEKGLHLAGQLLQVNRVRTAYFAVKAAMSVLEASGGHSAAQATAFHTARKKLVHEIYVVLQQGLDSVISGGINFSTAPAINDNKVLHMFNPNDPKSVNGSAFGATDTLDSDYGLFQAGRPVFTSGSAATFDAGNMMDDFLAILKYHALPAVAPAHACVAHFFSNLTLTYGGQVVSTITNHVPQVDAFDKRTTCTSAWFEREGLGNVTNFYAPDFIDRCAIVDGDYLEIQWQPPLAFFRFPHAIPSGDFRLNMVCDSRWKRNGFQTVGCYFDGTELDHNAYTIKDMSVQMYNYFGTNPISDLTAPRPVLSCLCPVSVLSLSVSASVSVSILT